MYQITIPDNKLLKILDIREEEANGMSDVVKEYLKSRAQNSIASVINRNGGTDMVIASTICSATKLFVSDEPVGNVVYLYTYENAIPVIVAFRGEAGAVSAYGDCILDEDFLTDTDEKIRQTLAEFDINIEVLGFAEKTGTSDGGE